MGYKRKEKIKEEMPQVGVKPEVKRKPIKKVVVKKVEKPFTVLMWNGIKEVYACTKCERQEDKKDDAVLHYLSHYPNRKEVKY